MPGVHQYAPLAGLQTPSCVAQGASQVLIRRRGILPDAQSWDGLDPLSDQEG